MQRILVIAIFFFINMLAYTEERNDLLPQWVTSNAELENFLKTGFSDNNNFPNHVIFDSVKIKDIRRKAISYIPVKPLVAYDAEFRIVELIALQGTKRLDFQCEMFTKDSTQAATAKELLINKCKKWDDEAKSWVKDAGLDISALFEKKTASIFNSDPSEPKKPAKH